MCRSRCGARYTVKDGKMLSVQPSPEHPTGGAICLKGKSAPEIIYSPQRMLYPMRRTTPKTDPDPGWMQITWEEALTEVARKLNTIKKENGAEAFGFAVTTPSGTPMSDSIDWVERFIRLYESPNITYAIEICGWHKDFVHKHTYGTGLLFPDYANAETILLWGFNPSSTWLSQAGQIAGARANGAKIIVVDPRNAGFAKDANHWLRVLPGTDSSLAMGLANELIVRGGYDAEFIKKWSNGPLLVRIDTGEFLRARDLDGSDDVRYVAIQADGRLVKYDKQSGNVDGSILDTQLRGQFDIKSENSVIRCKPAFEVYADSCSEFTLERVSRETSIPTKDIVAAADLLISSKHVAYYPWTGVGQQSNASQTDRAIALLMALKGCYDQPGGNIAFDRHSKNEPTNLNQLPKAQRKKALGLQHYPLGPHQHGWITANDLYTGILDKDPYPVRGLMAFGTNLLLSHADTKQAVEALKSLEFYVHCDSIENPTSRFADIFLPVNTPWEREGLRVGFEVSQEAEELIQLRQQMVSSLGESRSDIEIVFDLATRIGLSDEFYDGDVDKAYENLLEPTGVSLAQLREKPEGIRMPLEYRPKKYSDDEAGTPRGFDTETGRVEIYSAFLLRNGYPPIPTFPPMRSFSEDYPYALTTAKSGYFIHSSQRHIDTLRKREREPFVEVSSACAEANGFLTGDIISIETEVSNVKMKLRINDALHPRVVVASYGWWQENLALGLPGYDALSSNGANYNSLISSNQSDQMSGSLPLRSAMCRLSSANGAVHHKPAWMGFKKGQVTSVMPIATDVTQVSIRVDDIELLPDFLPGQHITLRCPIAEGDGNVTRSYSLINSAVNPDRKEYTIAVRRVLPPPSDPAAPAGKMSNFINGRLMPGQTIEISAPTGRFTMPLTSEDPIVLIAGGIGITPFLSYLETVSNCPMQPQICLLYANRNSEGHAYREMILELQRTIPTLTVVNVYNEPIESNRLGFEYDKLGFVSIEDIRLDEFDTSPDVFQCGPPQMMAAIEAALGQKNHPSSKLHKEAFASPPATKSIPEGAYDVTFAKSGKTIRWNQNSGTLLELAQTCGITLESGCRVGQCESCIQSVLSGSVTYLFELPFDEKDHCLTCQAYPSSDLVLDA